MSRAIRTWIIFILCVGMGLGAITWITRAALHLQQTEQSALRKATLEDKTRQAIWRMDSTFHLFLSSEGSRPDSHYHPFFPGERLFTRTRAEVDPGELLVPSPFLILEDPLVHLRFQIDASGHFTSPMVPALEARAMAIRAGADPSRLDEAAARLAACRGLLTREKAQAAMARQGAYLLTREDVQTLRHRQNPQRRPVSQFVYHGAWVPFWEQQQLFLVRQVWLGDQETLQACWMAWPEVRELLLSTIREILPNAELVALSSARFTEDRKPMASLPVQLLPGALPGPSPQASSYLKMALALGWGGILLAGLLAGLLLHRAIRFSRRKDAFVSAVAHELRTPLTTFRLYTELLASGMVPEEERSEFMETLMTEANRLDHLVRNVLSYARLEAGRRRSLETTTVEHLLERPAARLRQRAAQSGLELALRLPEDLKLVALQTDPASVEQILFNLVDNACKYAAQGKVPAINIEASRGSTGLSIAVQDHGPGIPREDRKRIFSPFHTGSHPGGTNPQGVGLGLALCRRMARGLGGRLTLDDSLTEGARFVLSLPLGS